ncbi:MAG TPA: WD40 repeat domain-containing protein [Pirellulales bacterium]|nr:WD40 repeat domain-containing protein [Pirellulales bacterium]
MHEATGREAWQTLGLTIVVALALSGCSGGGGIGSSQMQRQVEAATAARRKAAQARPAQAPATQGPPGSHTSKLQKKARKARPDDQATAIQMAIAEQGIISGKLPPELGKTDDAPPETVSKPDATPQTASKPGPATGAKAKKKKAVTATASAEKPKKSLHRADPARQTALSSDGSLLAIDGEDGSVRLLDVKGGSAIAAWPGQEVTRSALAIDPELRLVAAASADGPITLFWYGGKVQEGLDYFARSHDDNVDPTLRGHRGRVRALGIDRDGRHVISAGEDATVRVWRISREGPRAVAVGQASCVPAVGPGGKIAVATADHAVEMLEIEDARRSRRLERHKAPVTAIAFGHAKDLDVLVSADEKGRIHVWDFQTDRNQEFVGHATGVTALAFDETRGRIISTASDGSLRIAEYPASQSQLLANLSGSPSSLALTADQQYVALNVGTASVSVIPLAGDAGPASFPLRGENFTACAVARDGEVVLSGTATGSVVCQSRRDGTTVAEFSGARGAVYSLAVHPDGQRFAWSGDDGAIRIARLPGEEQRRPTDEAQAPIEAHAGPVRCLAFTPDGQMLISAGGDNMVRLWNLASRDEIDSFSTAGIEPTAVCGTRNGSAVVVACGKKTVLAWKRDAHKPASKLPIRGEVRSVALAPTGTLAVSMAEGDIQLWDFDRQLEIERLTGHTGPVDHVVFAGDTRLVSAGADKAVRLWSLSRTQIVQAHRGAVRGLAVSQDNGRIVTGGDDRRLRVWSPDGDLIRDDDLRLRITGFALHPRRAQVAFQTDDPFKSTEVIRWSLDEAAALEPLHTPSAVKAVAYSSDGKRLAVAGTDDTVRIYDSQGGTLLEEVAAVTSWATVRFTTGGEQLIGTETDDVVRTYPLRLHRCFKLGSPATCAAISPDREFVLAGGQDGDVRLWSVHSDILRQQMQGHADAITAVSFAGDGKTAFSADQGGAVRVWSLDNRRPPDQPTTTDRVLDHPGAVRALEPSTSGATLVSGCDDGMARVWDVGEAKTKESYAGQALPVVAVQLVDIGRSLLACNGNGIVNLWKRPTDAEVAKGASRQVELASAKSLDLSAVATAPPADDRTKIGETPQVAASEHLLRTAHIPAERDVWRKKIQATAVAPPKPADRPKASAKMIPRGHVPLSEIGKGDPWDLSPTAELKTNFLFDGTANLQIEMAISSQDDLVAAALKSDSPGSKSRMCVWDVATGVELRRWEAVRAGRWHAIHFAGSNDAFVYTLPDSSAFELATGKASHFADGCLALPLPNHDEVLFGLSTSPVAASQLLAQIDGGRFHKEWSGLLGYETLVTALACSPDGHWAAVGVRERLRHKLILFDLREMSVSSVLEEAPHAKPWSTEGPVGISDAIFSPDGKRLFWHGQYGAEDFRATTAVATTTGFNVSEKSIAKLKQPIVTNHVIGYVTGELDTIYLGTKTGLVLCEGKTGKITAEIKLAQMHGGQPEGDEKQGAEKQGAEAPASRVRYVVSTDGAWMASADDGGKVVLWDLTTPRRPCNTFAAHTGPVVGLRFSLDNHWLVTAGEENRLRVWSLAELQQRRQRQTARKAAARP